jgi:hypothetical protein
MRFGVRGFGRRAAARPGRGWCGVRRCGTAGRRHRGQLLAVGVCGCGVHGAGAVVVGQDHSEVVGGAVFGAAVHLVDACVGAVVMLVGLVGEGRINRQVVFVAAPSHADISHGTTRTIGQNRPAEAVLAGAANGHALGGSHGAGVAQGDVLAQVVAVEDDAGGVGEPLGGDPAPLGVDADYAPAVAVAHLVNPITSAVLCAGVDGQGGVVVAAQDEIARADRLLAGYLHAGSVCGREVVMEALVDGVGDLPGVAEDRDVFASATGVRLLNPITSL